MSGTIIVGTPFGKRHRIGCFTKGNPRAVCPAEGHPAIAAAVCGITFGHSLNILLQETANPRGEPHHLFLEHVAAMHGTLLNRFQRLLAKPWQWTFDGCHLNRYTHRVLGQAGFSSLDMDCFRLATPAVMIMPHIFGVAIR